MKLYEIYEEALNERNVWRQLEEILKHNKSMNEVVDDNMQTYLNAADKFILKPFNIDKSKRLYFIAGSARLYLYPDLVKELNALDPLFPLIMGDLDIVIPFEQTWIDANMGEYLEQGIYRPYALKPPITNINVEAFQVWDPKKVGGIYSQVQVRSNSQIMSELEEDGGYWFMALQDVLDYKGQMNRAKEAAVAQLILNFENNGKIPQDIGVPQTREGFLRFLKGIAEIITGNFGKQI